MLAEAPETFILRLVPPKAGPSGCPRAESPTFISICQNPIAVKSLHGRRAKAAPPVTWSNTSSVRLLPRVTPAWPLTARGIEQRGNVRDDPGGTDQVRDRASWVLCPHARPARTWPPGGSITRSQGQAPTRQAEANPQAVSRQGDPADEAGRGRDCRLRDQPA